MVCQITKALDGNNGNESKYNSGGQSQPAIQRISRTKRFTLVLHKERQQSEMVTYQHNGKQDEILRCQW